jgi:hypothetical protein
MLKNKPLLKFLAAPESVERHGCVRNGRGDVGKHNSARQLVGFQLEGILHRVGTKSYLATSVRAQDPYVSVCFGASRIRISQSQLTSTDPAPDPPSLSS